MGKQITLAVQQTKENEQLTKDRVRIINHLITYYSITELAEHAGKSERTLFRWLEKRISKREKERIEFNMGPYVLYSPELLFWTKNHKRTKNKDFARMLSAYSWDYTFTIGFENDYSPAVCRRRIEGFIDKLKQTLYATELQSRKMVIFFSIERYAGRNGYHIHGAMGFFTDETRLLGKEIFEKYFPANRVDRLLEEHDSTDFWVEYIIKHSPENPDLYDVSYVL